MNKAQLLATIANCTVAIKAFKAGMKHLAPADLCHAPSIEWLQDQRATCVALLERKRAQQTAMDALGWKVVA